MRTTNLRTLVMIPVLLAGLGLACSTQRNTNDTSYKDDVQNALKQADLTDVTVSENRDKKHNHARRHCAFRRCKAQSR
jgi:hypothetical protein